MTTQFNWFHALQGLLSNPKFATPGGIHRIGVYGEHGSGKSSAAELYAWASKPENLQAATLFEDCDVADLVGPMQLVNGSTKCTDQLASSAMRHGYPLLIDEIDQFSPSVATLLNAICDDWPTAKLCLPDGQIVRPIEGYCVLATTNESPKTLPPRLRDRFDVWLHADTISPGLLGSFSDGWKKLVETDFETRPHERFFAPISARRVKAENRLESMGYSQTDAIRLAFGNDPTAIEAIEASLAVSV
jgi:hypothetical protein